MEKKPEVMVILQKEIKLLREIQNGVISVNASCRPISNQFGIVRIQVTGEDVYL